MKQVAGTWIVFTGDHLSQLVTNWLDANCASRAKTNFYGALNLPTRREIAMRSDLMNTEVSVQ